MRRHAVNENGGEPVPASHTAALHLPASERRGLERCLRTAARLSAGGLDAGEGLRRLAADARLIEAVAAQARREGGLRLPAAEGRPRVLLLMAAQLNGGETPLTEKGLMEALRARPLTQAELWAVPAALRIAIAEGLYRVSKAIVGAACACADARAWVSRPRRAFRASPAFCEHALLCAAEEGRAEPRARIEARLRRMDTTAEQVIRRAHEDRAHDCLRLDNLMAAARLLDALDWQTCFEALSEVDAALRRDPAGIYPLMDDASRQRVRDQVACIARASGLPEPIVARHAVAAAREVRGLALVREITLDDLSREDTDPRATCCWWLTDDAGRRALARRLGQARLRLPRLIPDPHGYRVMGAIALLTAALSAALCAWLRAPALLPLALPIAARAANALIHRVAHRLAPPARLLKLEIDRLPNAWATLVVTPVLTPDAARADAMCDNLETLGCLEDDPNLGFLLLADFADADDPRMPGDDAIVARLRARVADMNARAGREKYHVLHRPRTLLGADGRYMGRDRKRGALEDLNRLLTGGPSAFSVEGRAADALRGRYRYVVTLDADTRMLPGTVHRLVGAMAHPMNRRYAVLQPRMEVLPSACVNRFARLFSGVGGVDTYPVAASSLWMDLTGTGVYGGKAIYDAPAFRAALDGALPEGRILSHDLIEGALAGAGALSDVALYDGCPAALQGWLKRLHRWTRGDWQLLPVMFSRRKIALIDRFHMLDNLIRSLFAPALLILFLLAAWTGDFRLLAAALASAFLDALAHPLTPENWALALASFAALPATAACSLDACLRALWRMFVSGKRLMDWVPSADAERERAEPLPWARIAAALALPGLLTGTSPLPAIALAAGFAAGPALIRRLENAPVHRVRPLTDAQRDMLLTLARDTWRFFEAMDAALPPDNVQLDPPVRPARRTSPTNAGLYLLSCIAARELELVDRKACADRVSRALDALERTPRWRGHVYNWIDIDTLQPLAPRYVSAVDSGNLAACALTCAGLIGDEALAARLRELAEGMDFAALYDADRQLFHIGFDAEAGQLSASHYDLLASEARILSFTAIMLNRVPLKHWARLGRACVAAGGGAALVSWSGTMFEYLMPELLTPAPALSLLGETNRAAVAAQMALGAPWGVSESGYHAFDAHMNYQYRAFGLPALALNGSAAAGVVAPYASALALAIRPFDAAENLERMTRLGWRGPWGFYEAADGLRPRPDGTPSLVISGMAHHQGMTLCALLNALNDDALPRGLMTDARARATGLLLEERPACVSRLRPPKKPVRGARRDAPAVERPARPECPADVHLLMGREARAFVTSRGAIHYARRDFDATRFSGDLTVWPDAARVWLRVDGTVVAPEWRGEFRPGCARFTATHGDIRLAMAVCLSPEDDALARTIDLQNTGDRPVDIEVMDVAPVALCRAEDWRAHADFQRLFVVASREGANGLRFRRRPRNPGEACPQLVHRAEGHDRLDFACDYARLMGRQSIPAFDRVGTTGAVLDPVSALRAGVTVDPGATRRVCFALQWSDDGRPADDSPRPDRAAQLSGSRVEAALGFIGLDARQYHLLDRLAALVLDPRIAGRAKPCAGPSAPLPREALWALGVSGDLPILSLRLEDPGHLETARALLRAWRFYDAMGLKTDLVLVDACAQGYDRPGLDALNALVDACAPEGRERAAGGVRVLSGLAPDQWDALRRASAVALEAREGFAAQVRALLATLETRSDRPTLDPGHSALADERRIMDNGFGGLAPDGSYHIDARPDRPTPAPWCNIIAHETMGLLLTERGGGFVWHENSRSGRLTPWAGDAPWLDLRLCRLQTGEVLPLLPAGAPMPFRVSYTPDAARYAFETEAVSGEVAFRLAGDAVVVDLALGLHRLKGTGWQVCAEVRWLMGADVRDAARVRTWTAEGACFASGAMAGVGYLACDSADAAAGDGLVAPVHAGKNRLRLAVGWAEHPAAALDAALAVRERRMPPFYHEPDGGLRVRTPDTAADAMMNAFLLHQVRASRLYGRTGFCQPGGAYGFRDQLQDMLALLPTEPERVRAHLLRCAARQFPRGDALHWWHMPYLGVRTRIADDRLFLPWVTAAYVRVTGDRGALEEVVPYLEDVPIPEDREDVFADMRPGEERGSLHDHCMRAFHASEAVGSHGLALMGAGDWNDGMNRVGIGGRGESVWLSEFIAACADAYAEICPDERDAAWLRALARKHRGAVELYGWDGRWYRRAFTDDGTPLGSAENDACQIDLIAQAWAVLGGLSGDRCRAALNAAWDRLVDPRLGLVRLLDPPFYEGGPDPGYIRGYPEGVRENGAQYTHAACWLLLALVRVGDAGRAHALLRMLLPLNHADTPERALRYAVEPYAMAGDVYALEGFEGRGGWTWYTGSAAWLYVAVLALLGFERRGDRVRLRPLLGPWPGVQVELRCGQSLYTLGSRPDVDAVTLDGIPVRDAFIPLADDGRDHMALFPPRQT